MMLPLFLVILEPHIVCIPTSSSLHSTSLLCCFIFRSRAMAGNDKSKSLNEAKNWRRERATRAGVTVPHSFSGDPPTSIVEYSWRRIDEGENVAHHPYQAIYSISNDTSPPPKKSRRRRYTEEEKAQVAETRRRGACGKCRHSRIKVSSATSNIS
jgi:hypothetical protein